MNRHCHERDDKKEMENLKTEEEFISGFCRTCNMGQTVCCEYTIQDKEKTLSFMDCGHERCVNTGACEIYRQAKALECK